MSQRDDSVDLQLRECQYRLHHTESMGDYLLVRLTVKVCISGQENEGQVRVILSGRLSFRGFPEFLSSNYCSLSLRQPYTCGKPVGYGRVSVLYAGSACESIKMH